MQSSTWQHISCRSPSIPKYLLQESWREITAGVKRAKRLNTTRLGDYWNSVHIRTKNVQVWFITENAIANDLEFSAIQNDKSSSLYNTFFVKEDISVVKFVLSKLYVGSWKELFTSAHRTKLWCGSFSQLLSSGLLLQKNGAESLKKDVKCMITTASLLYRPRSRVARPASQPSAKPTSKPDLPSHYSS